MSYADFAYYLNTWKGRSDNQADTEKYLDRAADQIKMISNFEFSELHATQQDWVKKANCQIAEDYITIGDFVDYNTVSIGAFSMSGIKKGKNISDKALNYLDLAGVLLRSVECKYH